MTGLSAAFPATSLTQITATVDEDVTPNQSASIGRSGLWNSNSLYNTITLDGTPGASDGTSVAYGGGLLCTARRDGSNIQVDIHTLDSEGDYTATATDTYAVASIPIVHYLSANRFWLIHSNNIRIVELVGGALVFGTPLSGTALNPASSSYHASGFIGSTFIRLGISGDVANTAFKYTVSGTTVTEDALTYDVSSMAGITNNVQATCENSSSLLVLTQASIGGNLSTSFTRFTLSGNTLTLATEYTATDIETNKQITVNSDTMLVPASSGAFTIFYRDNSEVQARVCTNYGSSIGAAITVSTGTGIRPISGVYHPSEFTYVVLYTDTVAAVTGLYVAEILGGAMGTATLLRSGVATAATGWKAQGHINSLAVDTANDIFFGTLNDVTNGLTLERFKDSVPFYKIGFFKDTVSSGSEATIHIRRDYMGILSEGFSGLTKGTNYYIGDAGLVSVSASGPFFGWAVDTDAVVVSENALS